MFFHLTTLIKKETKTLENKYDSSTMVVVDVWNHINFMLKNYILNG